MQSAIVSQMTDDSSPLKVCHVSVKNSNNNTKNQQGSHRLIGEKKRISNLEHTQRIRNTSILKKV